MASMASEPFCTVREFPASLCDRHLLPSAKIDTRRGYKNKSERPQKAKRPSTHMRSSCGYGSAVYGATVRHRRSKLYCNAIKHSYALEQMERPAWCRASPSSVFTLGCVAASIPLFVTFEVGGINTLGRFGFFAAVWHRALIAVFRVEGVVYMAAKVV
jgi:hypothetical protein